MGDIEALLEKAQFAIDEEKADKIGKKIIEGDFTFIDLYDQMEAMQKMGSLQKIIELIPGMGNLNIPKEMLNVQEDKLKKWKFILQSMTKKEFCKTLTDYKAKRMPGDKDHKRKTDGIAGTAAVFTHVEVQIIGE